LKLSPFTCEERGETTRRLLPKKKKSPAYSCGRGPNCEKKEGSGSFSTSEGGKKEADLKKTLHDFCSKGGEGEGGKKSRRKDKGSR